tara:strand:+ start:417 stop:1307 length:891 start_codon:yes stop_codon:yes gene_type:complete
MSSVGALVDDFPWEIKAVYKTDDGSSQARVKDGKKGGAELVNSILVDNFDLSYVESENFEDVDPSTTYVLSNISRMDKSVVDNIINNARYVILEHDYKIVKHRHPWVYKDNIVPEEDRINYDLYKNAKAIFVQTTDHLNVFKANDVIGNFVNLECSLWSSEDLDLLQDILESPKDIDYRYGILDSDNPIKNTKGAIKFCKDNILDYSLITNSDDRRKFLSSMASHSSLVFFPIARESCCRLVVEARALGMNVLTTKNYGAVLEPWFSLSGLKLIDFLRKKTQENLKTIKEYIYEKN